MDNTQHTLTLTYNIQALQDKPQKKPQHEHYDISEMHEYFCTKFCLIV